MLEQAVKTLQAHPGAHIKVVGNRNASEDKALASERASAVATKLTSEFGIQASQIEKSTGSTGNRTVQIYVLP
jgi:outer membrane protein OmpA-like peptidoglycan-associated protein